jgi:streptogramin lyase
MTVHAEFRSLAARAIDDELEGHDHERLRVHLASCAICRVVAAGLRSDALMLQGASRAMPAPGMRDRFERDWLPRVAGRPGPDVRLVLVLGALLLIALGALGGVGGATRVPTAPAPPSTTAGDHPVGRAKSVEVPGGPSVRGRDCGGSVELGCASDTILAFGSVWTTATDAIVRLDPGTATTLRAIPVAGHPVRLAFDDRFLWVTARAPSSIVRIDPETNVVSEAIPVDALPAGIALTASDAWVADETGHRLVRLDVRDGRVLSAVALPVAPWEVASTSGRIWATSRPGDVLVEIDARTGTMLSMSTVPGAAPLTAWDRGDGVTTAGELVLVASSEAVHRFDPVGTSFTTGIAPTFGHLAILDGRVWLVSAFTRVVEELDPITLRPIAVQPVAMTAARGGGDFETSIAVAPDAVWIRSYLDDSVIRLDRLDRG